MERLTYFKDGYWRVNFSGVQYQADFVDRLAAYEDIAELCGGFDRLRELAEADKDGRVVVLERENRHGYTADFSYRAGGKLIVEDVKSTATRTKEYLRNKKFMRSKFGIDIQEV